MYKKKELFFDLILFAIFGFTYTLYTHEVLTFENLKAVLIIFQILKEIKKLDEKK